MTEKDFKNIMRKVYEGDVAAFAPIYDEFYGVMVLTAAQILHNQHDAEDAVSSVILKVLAYAKSRADINVQALTSYFYTAVKNTAYDIIDRNKRSLPLEAAEDIVFDSDTENAVARNLDLLAVMDELDENERKRLKDFYFYDKTVREIAAELNMPEGTLKWKLKSIRGKLRDLFLKQDK